MEIDPVFLSRLQLAWVIGWHILLPAFTVGLASYHRGAGRARISSGARRVCASRISGSGFSRSRSAMGVVTGIVMPFQFGTNWAAFPSCGERDFAAFRIRGPNGLFPRGGIPRRAFVRSKAGAALGAFRRRLMVAIGTLFSSFWIMAVNSWMQTPAGYEIVDGRFFPTGLARDHLQPVISLSVDAQCCRILRDNRFRSAGRWRLSGTSRRSATEGQRMVMMALGFLTVLVPLQMVVGDQHGQNTREYQPAKLAAIEGRWDTTAPHAAEPVRDPGRKRRAQPLCHRDSLSWQPDPDPDL